MIITTINKKKIHGNAIKQINTEFKLQIYANLYNKYGCNINNYFVTYVLPDLSAFKKS